MWGYSRSPLTVYVPHFSVCPSSVLSDASFTSATGTAAAAATSKTVRRNLTMESQVQIIN